MTAKLSFKSNTSELVKYTLETGRVKSMSNEPEEPEMEVTLRTHKEISRFMTISPIGSSGIDLTYQEARDLLDVLRDNMRSDDDVQP